MAMELVLSNLTVGYRKALIKELNIAIKGPKLIQVLGPNGVGKTTLLKTVAGLIKPLEGKVIVNDMDVTGKPSLAGKYIAFVPQITLALGSHFPVSLWEFIKFAADLNGYGNDLLASKDVVITKMLELVGIPKDIWSINIHKLSGGHKQRMFIVRALLSDTPVILLDEPLSSIDPASKPQIIKLISELSRKRIVFVTTHDPLALLDNTDMMLLISSNRYFLGRPNDVMKLEILREVYGDNVMLIDKCLHLMDAHA